MSRTKSNAGSLVAYSNKDYSEADQLNRIRMYMIEPGKFDLGDDDWNYYLRLEGCFHLSQSELSRQVAINKIKTAYPEMTHHSAVMAFENSQKLFGTVIDNNRKIQKGKLIERLAILADKAFANAVFTIKREDDGEIIEEEHVNAEWMEMYRRLSKDIAELERYDKDGPEFNPDDIKIPQLIITSDPQAFLRSRNQDEQPTGQ